MKRAITLLASVVLIGCLSAEQPAPANEESSSKARKTIAETTIVPVPEGLPEQPAPAKEASNTIRKSMSEAAVTVYEGLPHQTFENDQLAKESKRKDTKEISSFRFYTPSTAVKDPKVLKSILSSSDSIQVFGGEKFCGGFHPDYAVQWTSEDGSQFFAFICFGCHEIIYSDEKNEFRYDLERDALKKLEKELAAYAKLRPKTKDG